MIFADIPFVALILDLMIASTPILLAATGELVVEKSGVLNLGVEGMMIIGAVCGFIVAVKTGNPWLGFLFAALSGAAISAIFGVLTQILLANQVACGLGLFLFGLGLSALLGVSYSGIRPPDFAAIDIKGLTDLPIIGPLLFGHDPMVYCSLLLVAFVGYFLNKTRAGLVLRAIGENHTSAHMLGYNVVRIRVCAILFGGACAGLGGAYLSLVRLPQWTQDMTAGIGWIALALVVFSAWRPWSLILGAYLFGGIMVLQLHLQAAGANIPVAYLSMAPYVITIIALVLLSANRTRTELKAPADLGRVFHASD